jgi:hypothetical protein
MKTIKRTTTEAVLGQIKGAKAVAPIGSLVGRLVMSVNQYVTTGDWIGVATFEGDTLLIPVNPNNPTDKQDFACFQSRIEEIQSDGLPVTLTRMPMHSSDPSVPFEYWGLDVPTENREALVEALDAHPGPMGWGSPKESVDDQRRRIERANRVEKLKQDIDALRRSK